MRDPRYRFTDEVRASTRAIAVRMIHAGAVAGSPAELEAWIARTDDLRATLTNAGYGVAFTAEDLFPLFQSFVARATGSAAARKEPRSSWWPWIAIVAAVLVVAAIVAIAAS